MSEIIVTDLNKKYQLGLIGSTNMRDEFEYWWAENILRKKIIKSTSNNSNFGNGKISSFWALKDINFNVEKGEVIGIIGKNGAGKSTLLKILSKITSPTKGQIKVRGRIASLLEVGTGFHPELSGRENIFLNGAILGMKTIEIKKKFDEIVEFSGISKFIDTPAKRYSSGMYVRLAFAVAAHLEPEILIVDEVLAVGDAEFQKKCLGKMHDVSAKDGRTVLLVSHNMPTIKNLCKRTILLNQGKIILQGDTDLCINHYLTINSNLLQIPLADRTDRQGTGNVRCINTYTESSGHLKNVFMSGESVIIFVEYQSFIDLTNSVISVAIAISNAIPIQITDLRSDVSGSFFKSPSQHGIIGCHLPKIPLNQGSYKYNICLRVNSFIEDWIIDAGAFDVEPGDFFNTGKIPEPNQGHILFDQKWQISS